VNIQVIGKAVELTTNPSNLHLVQNGPRTVIHGDFRRDNLMFVRR
jgi:hypothetical protein